MWQPGKDALGDMDPRLEHATWIEREPQPPEPIPPELERDALRAENEMLRRALDILERYDTSGHCPIPDGSQPKDCGPDRCHECVVEWAISEAGKE